ncbi:MAG: DNA repair protein RecO [Rhizobiales bacterium]|nr:DNA repair protein RecO [Hyphomicrobiales bacterium]
MQWTDDGIIIGTRRHGETSLIVELMTRANGRHLGLVRGGRSRRVQPLLQPGNSVVATWRARLDEHLGNYTLEPTVQRAARLIEGPAALYGIQLLAGLLRLLPERDSHPDLYEATATVVDWLDDPAIAGGLLAQFELRMLDELGFGLDLGQCAATGTTDDLVYVSPRTGRAVSRGAGQGYHDRLLKLPAFLVADDETPHPGAGEIADAFRLTGHFLARHVFEVRGLQMPEARASYLALIARIVPAEAAE